MLSNLLIEEGTVRKEVIGSSVSYTEVAQFLHPWDFPGKDDYMDFLCESNGLFFPEGLCLKSDLYMGLEVGTLYDLRGRIERYWAIAKENPDYPEAFTTRLFGTLSPCIVTDIGACPPSAECELLLGLSWLAHRGAL